MTSLILLVCLKCDITLANSIINASNKYNIQPENLIVIGLVESNLNPNVKLRYNTNGTTDVGPFQINSVHRKTTCKGLDIDRIDGNTHCAAKLIAGHSRKAESDPMWLARYHSKTPKIKRRYYKKILKYSKKLPNNIVAMEEK